MAAVNDVVTTTSLLMRVWFDFSEIDVRIGANIVTVADAVAPDAVAVMVTDCDCVGGRQGR
jgi:hypothetical protein